jgi:hypothetical protein
MAGLRSFTRSSLSASGSFNLMSNERDGFLQQYMRFGRRRKDGHLICEDLLRSQFGQDTVSPIQGGTGSPLGLLSGPACTGEGCQRRYLGLHGLLRIGCEICMILACSWRACSSRLKLA